MLVEHTRRFLLLLIAVALGSCGGGGGSPGFDDTQFAPPPPTPVPPPTAPPVTPPALALSTVAIGLDSPVFLTAPAGDRRQFIVERGGRIRIRANGAVLAIPFLDISGRVLTAGEGGLLSMAFDPRYAANGHYYIYYTDGAGDIVVERRTASANPNLSEPTSALEIIRIPHPGFSNHYGGLLAFGPDGHLYLGTGDGGGGGDAAHNAQNLNSLLGKLLRLDVRAATAASPYEIPVDNPFAGRAGQRGEIWASGLRNPWRYAFDGAQLYLADVGQDRREEVDITPAAAGGLNYGWNIMEGTLCYHAPACPSAGLVLPALEYERGGGACAIIGGYVYRGAALPELAGRYFYSDYCAGFLKSIVATAGTGVSEPGDWAVAEVGAVVSFGRDAAGELYLIGADGNIYQIVRG
jgi:glucose/arabinose dehydrogenase